MNTQDKIIQAPPAFADAQTVTAVTHWTDTLFSFRVTRPHNLRFRSGEFIMIGLMDENDKPILRAYSIASANWDDEIEFYSIKVPDGKLTSRLQNIAVGNQIIVKPKAVGSLILDALKPGKRLYMLSTGTGLAPFASLVRDPETYEKFDQVILTQTCRTNAGLAYGKSLIEQLGDDPLVGEEAKRKLRYYPTTTREPSKKMGRITNLLNSGELYSDLGVPPLSPEHDRVMICGSVTFNTDIKNLLIEVGLSEGSNNRPAEFVLEKAFVGDGI